MKQSEHLVHLVIEFERDSIRSGAVRFDRDFSQLRSISIRHFKGLRV